MKKIVILLSALALLCGCAPKMLHNIPAASVPAEHPDYAVIYFYRTGGFVQTPYTVYVNNDAVYRSKNKTKAVVRIDKPGRYEIWGKTESRSSLTVNIEMGKEYYVKTSVSFGAAIWRPNLELIDPSSAEAEFDSIR